MPLSFLSALCALCGQNSNYRGHTEAPSELSRILFCPALDDNFFLGVKLNLVSSLPVHNPKEAVFPSAEREIGHGRGDSDIDADVSGGRFIAEAARGRAA